MSMKTITGYVEIITFRNEENGYTIKQFRQMTNIQLENI